MIVSLIDFFRDRLKATIRWCYVLLAVVAIWGSFLVDNSHAHTSWEKFPFFWAVFGFFACALIIIGSKWFGHLGIMTREDYYDD